MVTRPAERESKRVWILTSKYGFEGVFSSQSNAEKYKAALVKRLAAYRTGANLTTEVETLDPEVSW